MSIIIAVTYNSSSMMFWATVLTRRTQIFLSTPFRTQCPKFLHLPTSQKWFMTARAGTVPTLTHSVIAPRHRPVLPIADGRRVVLGCVGNPVILATCAIVHTCSDFVETYLSACLSVRQPACLPDYGLQVCKPHLTL